MPLYGNLVRGEIPYAKSPNDITGDVAFTYDETTQTATVQNVTVLGTATFANSPSLPGSSISTDSLSPTAIQYASVDVSSASIKTLFSVGKSLVAPASNSINEFLSALFIYKHGSTAYTLTAATNLTINYTDINGVAASVAFAAAGFLDQSSDKYAIIRPVATNIVPVVQGAFVLVLGGADPTLGNGTLTIKIAYRVHSKT